MLTKLLKGNRNFIPAVIFILFGILFFLLNGFEFSDTSRTIAFVLFILTILHTALTVNKFEYFRENFYLSFLLAVSFLLISCCFEDLSFYAGFFMLMIIFIQMLFTYQNETVLLNGFDLAFFMGFAILFYPPFWLFSIFLIISFVLKGKTETVQLILSVLGLITAAVLAFELILLGDFWELWNIFKLKLNFNPVQPELKLLFLLPLLLGAVAGVTDYYKNLNRQSANKKLVYFDTLLFTVFAIIYVVLYGGTNPNAFLILIFPAALLTANFLTYNKVLWQNEVLMWSIVLGLLLYRFHQHIVLPEIFDQVTF